MTGAGVSILGPLGMATEIDFDPALPGSETTVALWLLTGRWHPLWQQFALSVVHLRETPTGPQPNRHFPGATHELMVAALNPKERPVGHLHSAETFAAGGFAAVGGWLTPIDVVHQFEATDAEMVQLAKSCAGGCLYGVLNPSTDDAREALREQWLGTCVRTLAHLRGEEHAR
jgi:hypothetical protein